MGLSSITSKIIPFHWYFLFLAIVAGGAAGVLAATFAWSALLTYRTNLALPELGQFFFSRTAPTPGETVRLASIQNEAHLSVVDFFPAQTDPEARYFSAQAVGNGVVLSSDGWIITHRTVFDPRHKTSMRVGVGPYLVPIDRIVEDTETGILFVKVSVTNVRPAVFRSATDVVSGGSGYLLPGTTAIRLMHIAESRTALGGIHSSETLASRILLVESAPVSFSGSPFVDQEGNVIGIAMGDAQSPIQVIPSDDFMPLFRTLLAHNILTRPALGVRGVSLDDSRQAPDRRGHGFLISTDSRTGVRGIDRGSAADLAGLRVGDVITRVGDVTITRTIDLSELFLAWTPTDTVDFTIIRDGIERTIPVTFGARAPGKTY